MEEVAIKIEGVSKKYTIGKEKDGSLRGTLASIFKKQSSKGEDFWALKNVSFEIKKGDVIGIIGKNGAGKSTLLKILSQITKPTEGRIEINGRVASLLEVGTGFHPELTGRENIFLNGTILGMSRKEVTSKFDEIVAFSGIRKFIDTPVKRYSSGQYVRLAFAVAAHLEPEILIIDEVLAVGDIEFQKKCLGKMKDVAGKGRTVIFVSHNMTAVKQLCNKAILINNGSIIFNGTTSETIEEYYLLNTVKNNSIKQWDIQTALGNDNIKLLKIGVTPVKGKNITIDSGFEIEIEFFNFLDKINLDCTLEINSIGGTTVYHKGLLLIDDLSSKKGIYNIKSIVPANLLNQDIYTIRLIFGKDQKHLLFSVNDIVNFEITALGMNTNTKRPGILYLDFETEINYRNA